MKRVVLSAALLCTLACVTGCASDYVWELEEVRVITGLKTPECLEVDPASGRVYVSNIDAATREAIGATDGNGFISRLAPGGSIRELRWVASTAANPIHSPKGIAFLDGYVYFADMTEVKRCRIADAAPAEALPLPGAEGLNDVATDGKYVYVSSTTQARIYRIDPTGKTAAITIPAPERINGITFADGKMFAVTVIDEKSDIYEIDPTGAAPPQPFGLAGQLAGMDGIEVLDDGTFLITEISGHKARTVSPDRKTIRTLIEELPYPADFGLDRKRSLVYIPLFFKNEATVYRLVRKPVGRTD